MSTAMLSVRGLCHRYGTVTVLHDLDLDVQRGEVLAVLGPSGGGKTTLLRLIAGFERPAEGSISLEGRVLADRHTAVAPEERRVGIVPQEGALFPHLSVGDNVGFGIRRRADRSSRVEHLLGLVGMAGTAQRRPAELSGGQQQRIALARALAPEPSILLLDEPFASLDVGTRARVRDEVLDTVRAAGATAILVTHDQQEAMSVADRVAVLLDGRIRQVGTPAEIYDAPADLDVATFVGDAVVLAGHADGATVSHPLGVSPVDGPPRHGPVRVLLRPEHLELSGPAAPGDPAAGDRRGDGVVVGTSFFGHDAQVRVRLDTGDDVVARIAAGHLPRRGDRLTVSALGPVRCFPPA